MAEIKNFYTEISQGGTEMLSPKVAQSIVNRTMAILGVHVNIMDAQAVVIAAGSPDRIGTFHAGAQRVLKTGKKLCVSYDEAKRMEGVKPGITLPITVKGRIIGAVGMTGEPADVESFGELLKLTAELMLEQAAVKEEIYLESRAREGLLSDLLTGHWREYEGHFRHRAQLFDYDLNGNHLVMAVEIGIEESGSGFDAANPELPVHKLRMGIQSKLSQEIGPNGKIVSCFIDGKLAVLYQSLKKDGLEEVFAQRKAVDEVYRILSGLDGVAAAMGVGGLARSWKDIHCLFDMAKDALRLGKVFYKEEKVLFYERCAVEHMLTYIPRDIRKGCYESILGPLLEIKEDQGIQWRKTLQAYFDNDMSSTKTSEKLFLHRNTLIFRLNKIKEAVGLQPQSFRDAIRLRLALAMLKLEEELEE